MLKKVLTLAFNSASRDKGKNCLINYVWINKEMDSGDRKAMCSVSFKHIDCAYKNARKYPDARVKIWIDYRFLDERSKECLQNHHDMFAPKNVEFCDLNDIESYRENETFKPGTTKDIWGRVDLARLIVLDHVLKNEPEPHVFYADFDVPDMKIEDARRLMDTHGLALGTTGAEHGPLGRILLSDHDLLENGYFAFKKSENGAGFLKDLLAKTFERYGQDPNGYYAFRNLAREWAEKHAIGDKKNLAVRSVLYAMGYKIPDNRRYRRLNWN